MFRSIVLTLSGLTLYTTAAAFPLCMYGVDKPEQVKTLKKAGFTCLQTYKTDPEILAPLAKQAKKYGLQVVFYTNKIIRRIFPTGNKSFNRFLSFFLTCIIYIFKYLIIFSIILHPVAKT